MIKDQNGFSSSGNWYKGNLHSHTVNSDGKLTPEESVRLFREHGYSFLCFSEHDLYTDYRSGFWGRNRCRKRPGNMSSERRKL